MLKLANNFNALEVEPLLNEDQAQLEEIANQGATFKHI